MKDVLKERLIKKIGKLRKENLEDCWDYHRNILKLETRKSELLDYLYDVSLEDWEDVGFFVGYLRCLDDMQELIED